MTNFKVTEDKYILEELTMRTLNFKETASNPVNKEGGDWQKKKKKRQCMQGCKYFFSLTGYDVRRVQCSHQRSIMCMSDILYF